MTAEEIVKEIQNGNEGLYLLLWQQIEAFLRAKTATLTAIRNTEQHADDILQECFLLLYTAVPKYENRGKRFLGYFWEYYYPKAYQNALYSGRSEKQKQDPINQALSLDAPLKVDDNEIMLVDTIADESAEQAVSDCIENIYTEQLREILTKAIGRAVKHEAIQEALMLRLYYPNMTLKECSQQVGFEGSYTLFADQYRRALRDLRQYFRIRENRAKIDLDSIHNSSRAYRNTLTSFKRHKYTSTTEALAIRAADTERRAEWDRWLQDILQKSENAVSAVL